tara:strand:+ start:674 stop:937 length:264 start_codon:yes stop_codon:yes gene_type:complete
MSININDLKKKILYRSNYRGIKELDILLSNFTQSIVDQLNEDDLLDLFNFLNLDDEILYKYYHGMINSLEGVNNYKIIKLYKNFKIK